MTRWLVIGGAAVLGYLLLTSSRAHALTPGGQSRPLPLGPPAQNPAPMSTPQTTVVPGASTVLQDIKAATGVAGDIVDVARKFGLFGSSDGTVTGVGANADGVGIQGDPAAGAAFF